MNEEEILKEFQDLQSEIREDKIRLELDHEVSQFVEQLFERFGWLCYFHIISNCLEKNSLIYYSASGLDKDSLLDLLDRYFKEGSGFFADILSKYLEHYESTTLANQPSLMGSFQGFVEQGALKSMNECLEYCPICDEIKIIEMKRRQDSCVVCQSKLFHIMQASVPDTVRSCISNGQLLEIYVKKCLQKAGFRIITKRVNGAEVSTSIPYHVYANDVEIDVGAVQRSSLIIFECKTGKLTPNDVSQKLTQLKLLIETFKKRRSGLPDLHVRFVGIGEIDQHVEPRSYESAFAQDLNLKSLEIISREGVASLTDYLIQMRAKL